MRTNFLYISYILLCWPMFAWPIHPSLCCLNGRQEALNPLQMFLPFGFIRNVGAHVKVKKFEQRPVGHIEGEPQPLGVGV